MDVLVHAVIVSVLVILSLTFISGLIIRKKKSEIKYDVQKKEGSCVGSIIVKEEGSATMV